MKTKKRSFFIIIIISAFATMTLKKFFFTQKPIPEIDHRGDYHLNPKHIYETEGNGRTIFLKP